MSTSTRARSMIASGGTAATELVVFVFAASLLTGPGLAAARWLIGASGSVVNFGLNRRWAFGATKVRKREQGPRWAAVSLSAVTLATLIWWAVVTWTTTDPRVAHVASMLGVWLFYTYPMMRRWVFGATGRASEPA